MAAFQKAIDATDRTASLSFTDSSQPIQIAVGDLSGVSISVSGTFTGSLSFEGSVSGTSWSAIDVHLLSDNSKSATITATGQYGINPTPFSQIRIVPAVASGSALVELLAVKTSSFNWLSAIWKLISDRIPALSNGKIPVEVGSLNVTVGNASLEIANDAGNPIPISDAGGSITVDGTFWQTTQPISAASLPLPSNAATSANQTTANTSLSSIDTKTPALGQALAAASTPVVLPVAQVTALTPPTTVGVNSLPALSTGSNAIGSITNTSFGISGTLPAFTNTPTFNIGTAPTIAVTGAFYQATQPVSLSTNTPTLQASSAIVGKVGIDQTTPGTTNKVSIGNDGTVAISGNVAVTGNFYQATQPISVASLPLPTQASTSALQTTGNTSLATIAINTGNIPANLTVSSTRLLVDNSGVTQPVSGTITANLGTIAGVATATNQETTNTSLASINSKIPALGQALAASSTPVVLTASQLSTLTPLASVGITGTLPAFANTPTFNIGTAPNLTITNTAFTVNAGTNLNTSALALESGGNLAGINTKLPASLGAKAPSASLSVIQAFAATSTLANVASSATSVTLLAANNNRKTAIIINDSTSDLYVTLNASAASTTNYSLFLVAKVGNTPSSLILNGDNYSGEIRGIWSNANGFARITEVV